MIPTDIIEEFVKRVQEAGGANVESVVLFGSAAADDFHPGLSNVNLLCILRDSSFQGLQTLAPAAKWWDKQKQPPPLCMTRQEIERSTDVFTIELLDMKQHHRVLFGEDVLTNLQIPMDLHRVQVEYELREKLLLLRQHALIASGNESRLWEVLLHSAPSFSTLFRHALIALGDSSPVKRQDAVKALALRLGFDADPVLQVLDVREKKLDRQKLGINELAMRYLGTVEKVVSAVDLALEEKPSKRG
jgi:hypothetical protein